LVIAPSDAFDVVVRSPEGLTAYIQYVLNIPNMSSKPLNQAHQQFIEDIARLLVPWGVPQTAARIHGYLLLSAEPVSLDRIAADLEVSKSGASVAARLLEKYGLALRRSERGSKRALYAVSQNFDGMLIEQSRLIDGTARLLQRGADTVGSGKVKERLEEMVAFYLAIGQAMDAALQSWRARR
jgi:DNA-binding transcriptional regulator GbsR (MarR family)